LNTREHVSRSVVGARSLLLIGVRLPPCSHFRKWSTLKSDETELVVGNVSRIDADTRRIAANLIVFSLDSTAYSNEHGDQHIDHPDILDVKCAHDSIHEGHDRETRRKTDPRKECQKPKSSLTVIGCRCKENNAGPERTHQLRVDLDPLPDMTAAKADRLSRLILSVRDELRGDSGAAAKGALPD
jgi:hypothetical protein